MQHVKLATAQLKTCWAALPQIPRLGHVCPAAGPPPSRSPWRYPFRSVQKMSETTNKNHSTIHRWGLNGKLRQMCMNLQHCTEIIEITSGTCRLAAKLCPKPCWFIQILVLLENMSKQSFKGLGYMYTCIHDMSSKTCSTLKHFKHYLIN